MSKASRSQAIEPVRMNVIASRIHRRMRALGFSQTEMSAKCSIESAQFAEGHQPSLSRDRISKVLMNRHAHPNDSAARSLNEAEFRTFASVLGVSVEWLRGDGLQEDPVIWNILAEPNRVVHLLHLLDEYEQLSGDSLVWSEYPLCSFMTDDFMVRFHSSHFGEMDTLGVTQNKRQLVEFFNTAGRSRRKRILRANRSFTLTNLVYKSEIERIVDGTGDYRTIPRIVRKTCLEELANVIQNRSLRMRFLIIDDQRAAHLRSAVRDYETVGVMGDLFSVWNYHSGSIGWTEHSRHVKHHRRLLQEMSHHAIAQDEMGTVDYLRLVLSDLR